MTSRVILGRRGSSYGMWVSKPGVDVETAGLAGLLLSTDRAAMQIVATGVIASPTNGGAYDFAVPNLGFVPLVLTSGATVVGYTFPSLTTLRIFAYSSIPYAPSGPTVHWAMTNQAAMI